MSALKLPFPFGYLLEHSPVWMLWTGLVLGASLFGIDLVLIDPLPFLDELTFLGISTGSLMELKRRRDAELAKIAAKTKRLADEAKTKADAEAAEAKCLADEADAATKAAEDATAAAAALVATPETPPTPAP